MLLIVLLVFSAFFGLAVLLMMAFRKPETPRQTQATLASVIRPFSLRAREGITDISKEHRLSSILWLHNLLSRINLGVALRRLLIQADLNWTPGKLILISSAAGVVSAFLINLRVRSVGAALIVGVLVAALPFFYVRSKRQSRLNRMQERLPDALDLMVSALRAGHSAGGALAAAAREAPPPLGREFRLCFEEQNFGIDLRTSMQNMLERVPLQDLRMVATAMLIHKESGGNLAEVLEKTGNVIRERFRLRQQIQVHTAQGRLTGVILSTLPLVLGAVLFVLNPAYIEILFTNPVGRKIVMATATLNVIGLLIIRKIVRIRI